MDTANPYPSGGLSLWSTKRERADQKREQLNLSHITGVAVCTVSDDESTVHRASVKLTWTTWSSRCTPWFPGASLLAHAPRGSPDVVGGPMASHLQSDSTLGPGILDYSQPILHRRRRLKEGPLLNYRLPRERNVQVCALPSPQLCIRMESLECSFI